MKKNQGVTLVSMIIMIIMIAIIASVSVINGTKTVKEAKEQQREQNLANVKAVVSRISIQDGTEGSLTPANHKVYGTPAGNVWTVEDDSLNDWYILEKNDLEEMGIEYVDETYVVNYKDNQVYYFKDFNSIMLGE